MLSATSAPIVSPSDSLEFSRQVSAPDPDGSVVPRFKVPGWPQMVRIGAMADTPGAAMSARIYLLDSEGGIVATIPVSFQASGSADWGVLGFSAVPTPGDAAWPLGGAKFVAIKVDAVSRGNWSIRGALA